MVCPVASNMPLWSSILARCEAWFGSIRSIGWSVLAVGSSDRLSVGTAMVLRLPSSRGVGTYISSLPLGTLCPPRVGLRGGWGSGETNDNHLCMANDIIPTRSPDSDRIMDIGIPTLQPYLPHGGQGAGSREINRGQGLPHSNRVPLFLDVKFNKPLEGISIFQIYRELKNCCQSIKKVRQIKDDTLLVQVARECQAKEVLKLRTIAKVGVTVTANRYLNQVKGVIFNRKLMNYPESVLQEELADQGVVEVKRIKRKEGSTLVDTPMLILTFDREQLPDKIMAAWYAMDVRQYQPAPRRCYNCQRFGHLGSNCRSQKSICVKCAEEKLEAHTCSRTLCANCKKSHLASDKNCEFFKMEKEILSIQNSEKSSYAEARRVVYRRYNRTPGRTWAQTVEMTTQLPDNRHTQTLEASASPQASVPRTMAPEHRQTQETATVSRGGITPLEDLPPNTQTPALEPKEQRQRKVSREERHAAPQRAKDFKGFPVPRAQSWPRTSRVRPVSGSSSGGPLIPDASAPAGAEGGSPVLTGTKEKGQKTTKKGDDTDVLAPSPDSVSAESARSDSGSQAAEVTEMDDISDGSSRKRARPPPQSPEGKQPKQRPKGKLN